VTRTADYPPLTTRMEQALRLLASTSAGAKVRTHPQPFLADEIQTRTAWALERRGLCQRFYTGQMADRMCITDEGAVVARLLDPDGEES
jgi:hypothetical protein